MRTPFAAAAIAGLLLVATVPTTHAAQIVFDLNSPDALLQGTVAPYATVTVSTQGTGTASFSVVAGGAYSLSSFFFQINPGVFFKAPGKADFTGGVSFGGFDPVPISFGTAGAVNLLPTDQFGGFGFAYKSLFGTVKSLSFTLTGPFLNVIQDVIIPNEQGFLAAAQIYNGDVVGYVGGNGSPTQVTAVPEPSSIALFAAGLGMLAAAFHFRRRIRKQGAG